ncbi:MAG: hypothetical protein VR70_02035 [Rhodospirillaceae bacterium BRH_c57]|nr:MAG: hypothetical protein VR70_02035 [Rhodospirillaceae bacterium BRH_c57]
METGRRADLAAALFLGLAGVLGACAAPPLDIPRAEWSGMTADQQALAVDKAAELAAGRTQAALPETQAAIRRDAVSEAARHARVAENYTSGRLGDVVLCTLGPGDAGGTPFAAVEFLLAREQQKTLGLTGPAGLWVTLSQTGQSLRLCRADAPAADSLPCTAVAAPFRVLEQGITWQVGIPGHLSAPLHCQYAVASGMEEG